MFTYIETTAYNTFEQQEMTVATSNVHWFQDHHVCIIDDLHGNSCITSYEPNYHEQAPEYIIGELNLYHLDGPYHNRGDAERYISGEDED